MALRIFYQSVTGEFAKAMEDAYRPIAEAGTNAIHEMAETIKSEGRSDIAAAGFGKRWQNTFRVDVYPNGRRISANAAALVYHKIPYADIFESGGTIRGKSGKLWLPLKSTPKKVGRGFRLTPKRFTQEIGPLFSMTIGGKPFLAAKMSVTRSQARSGNYGNVTLPRLRKGAASAKIVRAVPLFVGVDSVTLRDRFSLREITNKAADRLGALYAKHLNAE